jgi:hypothetical protein
MATPTLVAVAGGTTSNTYSLLAESEAYMSSRVAFASWDDAEIDEKNKALLMACRIMDILFEWKGFSTFAHQALQWPMQGLMDLHYRDSLDDQTVPQRIKEAQTELAAALLKKDRTLDSLIETFGLTSFSVSGIAMAFKDSVKAKVVPDAVANMIPEWWGCLRSGNQERFSQRVVRV